MMGLYLHMRFCCFLLPCSVRLGPEREGFIGFQQGLEIKYVITLLTYVLIETNIFFYSTCPVDQPFKEKE